MAEFVLDPEIKELLAGLARDPGARLLRIPRGLALEAGPLEVVPSASAGTAGWTPAERHLLQVHREEVADLLWRAFRAKLNQDPVAGRFFVTPPEDAAAWKGAGIGALARDERLNPDRSQERSLLEAILTDEPSQLPDYHSLAVTAERLVPGPFSQVYRGIALVVGGKRQDAERLLEHLESKGVSRPLRAFAWTTRAVNRTQAGEAHPCLEAYSRAWQLRHDYDAAALGVFLNALELGEEVLARTASVALEQLIGENELEHHIQRTIERAREGALTMSTEATKLWKRLEDGLGPISWRIGHALLSQ
jgi:hypothetical protein